MKTALLTALFAAGMVTSAAAQTVAITGATVVPVSGPAIRNGTVVIEGDRITAVGANVAIPSGARVIDASGKFVYPGMIDSQSRVGLYEIGSVRASLDFNEIGDFNPAMAVHVALNAHSDLIPVTRVNGVTSVLAVPSGGRIPGTAALIDLDGWTPDELARVPYAALMVAFPQLERSGGGFGGFGGGGLSDEEFRRRGQQQVRELEEYFAAAQSYAERKARSAVPEVDRQLEAMVPVMRGERKVAVLADTPDQILGALRMAERFGLEIVIVGGDQAWRVVDSLAARQVPVVLGSILSNPGRDQPFDAIYAQPAVLAARGVTFAFSTGGDAANARNLPYHAAMAVAHGLAPDAALEALTQGPAEIWGVGDALGTLEAGKVANLFIADGDPLDVRTTVEQVFIRGRPVEMESRHTRLYERFRGRPTR